MDGAMTEVIGKAGGEPKRQHKIHQQSPQDFVGPHVRPPSQPWTDKSASAQTFLMSEFSWNSPEAGRTPPKPLLRAGRVDGSRHSPCISAVLGGVFGVLSASVI